MNFFVYGTPTPQGSLKAYPTPRGIRLTHANPKLKPWREAVKSAAVSADIRGIEGPVAVTMRFFLPRPKSYPERILYPWKKPDLDKLVRGVFDALTEASAWTDDALAVDVTASKRFSTADQPMGCDISIEVVQ